MIGGGSRLAYGVDQRCGQPVAGGRRGIRMHGGESGKWTKCHGLAIGESGTELAKEADCLSMLAAP